MALVSHLTNEVLLETFFTGLEPMIKVELECWESMSLDAIMDPPKNRK